MRFLGLLFMLAAQGAPLFTEPGTAAATVAIEVRRGERVTDLVDRLARARLVTAPAAVEAAERLTFAHHPFVPPPEAGLRRLEGLFLPGTLTLPAADVPTLGEPPDPRQAAANAYRVFSALVEQAAPRYERLGPARGLGAYEILVLASIIEKEAITATDYGLIAGVLDNRLGHGAHLGSCVTVEYALGYHRPFLTLEDVAADSPYNTYLHLGLPPTPIGFFGEEALDSALHPPATANWFFCFDWVTRRHYFAATYEDHLRNAALAVASYTALFGETSLHQVFGYAQSAD